MGNGANMRENMRGVLLLCAYQVMFCSKLETCSTLEYLGDLGRLQELTLSNTRVGLSALRAVVEKCTLLRVLDLSE